MTIIFEKCVPSGCVYAPCSKSITHRAFIIGSFCRQPVKIGSYLMCDDTSATLQCLEALHTPVELSDSDAALIHAGPDKTLKLSTLDCRSSASTFRFMIPVSLVKSGGGYFTGSKRLLERITDEELNSFRKNGVTVLRTGRLICFSGGFHGGEYTVDGSMSSQLLSGLLMSLPFCGGDSVITVKNKLVSRPYTDITLGVLREFGVEITNAGYQRFFIKGDQKPAYSGEYITEGDYSNAAVLSALTLCGGEILIKGLKKDSLQGDRVFYEVFEIMKNGFLDFDVSDTPDLVPVLMVCASLLNGCSLSGVSRLKNKECDRVAVMCREMAKFGIHTQTEIDTVTVYPSVPERPSQPVICENDHRIAMSLCVLLCKTGGVLQGAECVGKSYPAFFNDLKGLNVDFCEINGEF